MKNRKTFAVLAALLSLFVLTGIAVAQDQVTVSVTSEPIQQDSSCDKAGGFSLAFDSDTVLATGDQITIDLDLGVTLCRTIDIEISSNGDGGVWTAAGVMAATANDPVYYVDDASGTTSDLTQGAGGGIYFRVAGTVGSQRITLSVLGAANSSLIVGSDPGDALVLKFLDQDVMFDNPGIFTADDADGSYDDAAELADNTICIDVSSDTFTATKVQGNMDSKDDKFSFVPSNPQIAHVVPEQAYQFAVCKDRVCGEIELGSKTSTQSGGSESCITIDNEVDSDDVGTAYCDGANDVNKHDLNNLIIQRTDSVFDTGDYNITLTILVNGEAGDNGVYFTNDALTFAATDDGDTACAYTNATGNALTNAVTYYNASNSAVTPVAGDNAECDVATTARAVKLMTSNETLGITGTQNYLFLNLPALHYDLDEVTANDVISIQVDFIKAPCGELFSDTWCIGTLVAACTEADTTVAGELLYPYFTSVNVGWWNGIVVDNLTSTAGTFTAYIYEQDGDQATFTSPTVNANSSYLNLYSAIVADPGLTITVSTGSGVIGDSPCYILVCTSWGAADGFAMISSTLDSAVDGSESMGYLPRIPATTMCP